MVAIANEKPVLPEPEFSAGALGECGGLRVVARVLWQIRIEPRLSAEDFGDVPAEVAVLNGRAIAADDGVIFAAYHVFGTRAMTEITLHVIWRLGPNPAITVRLAAETAEAG